MSEITPEYNKKLVDNLLKSIELLNLYIEFRKSYLKTKHKNFSYPELEKLVFPE